MVIIKGGDRQKGLSEAQKKIHWQKILKFLREGFSWKYWILLNSIEFKVLIFNYLNF